METIDAVNVNDAYVTGLHLLAKHGQRLDSRNGPVLVFPEPVTTCYSRPTQRVLFNAQRDANPFFHLFEALWMLAGRNDLAYLTQFLPTFAEFSDDGLTLHGAYGHRWRHYRAAPPAGSGYSHVEIDQLQVIIKMLRANPLDRRAVLAMWDVGRDLGATSKDIPCNDLVKFRARISADHPDRFALDMYVFCRSNDAVYGAYGANAVHFSVLQEYLAAQVGMDVGVYEQISTDFHAYLERPYRWDKYYPFRQAILQPYARSVVETIPLVTHAPTFDSELTAVMRGIDAGALASLDFARFDNQFFAAVVQPMYQIFRLYRTDRRTALSYAEHALREFGTIDWLLAAQHWIVRRLQTVRA